MPQIFRNLKKISDPRSQDHAFLHVCMFEEGKKNAHCTPFIFSRQRLMYNNNAKINVMSKTNLDIYPRL